MNWERVPQKVTKKMYIYSGKCNRCNSTKTFGLINVIDCNVFHCQNCKQDFKSTVITGTHQYETEE